MEVEQVPDDDLCAEVLERVGADVPRVDEGADGLVGLAEESNGVAPVFPVAPVIR